jgi:hypothetical protein
VGTPAIRLLSGTLLRLLGYSPHIENDFLRSLPIPHLEDVDKPHFDVASERKMPITVFHNIEVTKLSSTTLSSVAKRWSSRNMTLLIAAHKRL